MGMGIYGDGELWGQGSGGGTSPAGTRLWWGHGSMGTGLQWAQGSNGGTSLVGTRLHGDGVWWGGAPWGHIAVGMGLLWDSDPWVPVSVGDPSPVGSEGPPAHTEPRRALHPDPGTPPTLPPPLPPWHPPALIGAGAVLGCGAELPGAEPAGARSAGQNGREVPHGAAGAAASSGAGGGMGTSGRPTRDERCGCGTAGRGDGASRERPPRGPAVLRAVVPVPPAGRTSGGPPRWAPTQFLPLTLPGGSRPPPTLPPRSLRGTVRRPCVGKG